MTRGVDSAADQLRRQAAFEQDITETFIFAVERIRQGDRRMFERFLCTIDDTIDTAKADMAATLANIEAEPGMWLSLFAHGFVRWMEEQHEQKASGADQ